MTTSTLNYDAYDELLQKASIARTLTMGDDLTEHDTGQWAAGTYYLGDGRTLLVHLGGTATLTEGDTLPEPAADPLKGARCPHCAGVPSIATGLPCFVRFFDTDGGFVVGVDTAELGSSEVDEVQWEHDADCPGMTDAERYDVAAEVLRLAGIVGSLVAPECDGNLPA